MIDCRQRVCLERIFLVLLQLLVPCWSIAETMTPATSVPTGATTIFSLHDNASGRQELLAYFEKEKKLARFRVEGGKFVKLAEGTALSRLCAATRYLSGNEHFLALAFGNIPISAAPIRLVRMSESLQDPEVVFETISERPEVNALQQSGNELVLNYFESKYFTQTEVFTPNKGKAWQHRTAAKTRMATSLALADNGIFLGRPYGDVLGQDGDVQFLQGSLSTLLPSYRGVSSMARFAPADAKLGGILIGDGWHQNYAAFGQARLSLLSKHEATGRYAVELIENIPGGFRLTKIAPFSAEGKDYVLAATDKAIFRFTPAASWKRETVYEQSAENPFLNFVYLGVENGKANLAILDGELKLIQIPLEG